MINELKRITVMNIKINRNDYVQPTEVRWDIVQLICDVIIDRYMDTGLTLNVYKENPVLVVGKSIDQSLDKSGCIISQCKESDYLYEYTRIRSCEMHNAFNILQEEAGYYVYSTKDKKYGTTRFWFSKKPYSKGVESKYIDFNLFID